MENRFSDQLENCSDYSDIFELVKTSVEKTLDKSRAGLMLGLANLGGSPGYFLGAYYTLDTNMIILNKYPLDRLAEKKPCLVKPYIFQVLLHEYIHTLGWHDEAKTRKLTHQICRQTLGDTHAATQMARDLSPFMPLLSNSQFGWSPQTEPELQIVSGFDRGNLTYVA